MSEPGFLFGQPETKAAAEAALQRLLGIFPEGTKGRLHLEQALHEGLTLAEKPAKMPSVQPRVFKGQKLGGFTFGSLPLGSTGGLTPFSPARQLHELMISPTSPAPVGTATHELQHSVFTRALKASKRFGDEKFFELGKAVQQSPHPKVLLGPYSPEQFIDESLAFAMDDLQAGRPIGEAEARLLRHLGAKIPSSQVAARGVAKVGAKPAVNLAAKTLKSAGPIAKTLKGIGAALGSEALSGGMMVPDAARGLGILLQGLGLVEPSSPEEIQQSEEEMQQQLYRYTPTLLPKPRARLGGTVPRTQPGEATLAGSLGVAPGSGLLPWWLGLGP